MTARRSGGPRIAPSPDGLPEPGVQPTGVADGSVALRERLLDRLRGAEAPRAGRLVEAPAPRQVVAVERHVIVAVDQTGQDRPARYIDNLGILRPGDRARRGDRVDAAIANDDGRIAHGCGPRTVDQGSALEHDHRAPSPLASARRNPSTVFTGPASAARAASVTTLNTIRIVATAVIVGSI